MNIVLLLLLLAGDKPPLVLENGNILTTSLPAKILDDDATRRRLLSGLTLSIELDTHLRTASKQTRTTYTLITVRYEVWEERILVRMVEGAGGVSAHDFEDLDAFFAWIEKHPIQLATAQPKDYPLRVRVKCHVLPYTDDEAAQTRKWFSQKLKVSRIAGSNDNAGSGISEGEANGVFEVLMSGGIRRRALRTFKWKWDLPKEDGP